MVFMVLFYRKIVEGKEKNHGEIRINDWTINVEGLGFRV
jgi:hypothetical protein